ncbi:hypothetical protein LINPERHAP2_LOCUS39673 [Linum perenne]
MARRFRYGMISGSGMMLIFRL